MLACVYSSLFVGGGRIVISKLRRVAGSHENKVFEIQVSK